MKNRFIRLACFSLAAFLCACSGENEGSSIVPSSEQSSAASQETSENEKKGAGQRIPISLEQAVLKKNNDEQFIVMYVKDGCEYCAEFDEVLNPYLQEHPLTVYEVSLSEAEKMYSEEDKDTMLKILTAGVSRTPALYYIESQKKVNLLDHTHDNYSEDGLRQWVEKYDLERLK